MRRRDAEIVSHTTGEAIPNWLELDKDVVVEGVGDIVVREEDDGTWSVVRSVDGAEPEADRGHPSEAEALRLAKAYSEGGKIVIERRTSKEVEAAGIHKGMVAKYGEDDVTLTSVSGNDVKILFPGGDELDVDVTQLSEIREAQDVGVPPMTGETPPDMSVMPGAMPGMMAGDHEEEEEELLERGRELIRKWEELEKEEELEEEELEEEEEELGGTSIGPPVYFVEIEPLPGQRQSPLGASKTAAVYLSQEKGEQGRERRVDVHGILDLYKSIGIPLQRAAEKVKIGGIFLISDAESDTYRLEEELINGEIRLLTKDMAREEAETVMEAHTDLPQGTVSQLVGQAKENGSLFLGDRLGYLVQADVLLSPTEDMTGFVLTQDGMVIEGPMDEEQARATLRRSTSLMDESIERAIEFASAGHSPRIANVKIAREPPVCKKCHQRHWPFQPCPGTEPEKEKPAGRGEEKAEEKEAAQEKTSGRVRMYFDWDEFFNSVVPQLSNGEFQQAFDTSLSAAQDDTISEEEKDARDEEVLLFGREAHRRGLPYPSDVVYGLGDRVALASEPDVQGDIEEYRLKDDEINYLVNLVSGSSIWFKESELKPTTNPDTTTTPWTERSKKITDPENKRQTSDFQKDLKQKTGQEVGEEYTLSDEDAEGIAVSVVDQLVTESDIREAAAENPDLQPGDIALNLNTDIRSMVEKDYPAVYESDPDLNLVVAYATNYIASMFPRPPGEFVNEYAMKVGALAKIVSGYETDDAELQDLRDRGVAGKVVELNDENAAVVFGSDVLLIGRKDLEVVGNFFRECTIRKCAPADRNPDKPADEQVWCLYTKHKPERVLGRHKTKPEAIQQEKAIKARGGALTVQGAEICPEFVQRSLKDEEEAVKEYGDMIDELPQDSPERARLEEVKHDEEAHVSLFKKWKKEGQGLSRLAPGLEAPPGTPGPASRDRAVSAPPGAPSRGRPRREEPPEVCVCPITGKEYPKERGVECSSKQCPEHPGVRMVGKPRAGVPPIPPGAPPRELKPSSSYRTAQEDIMQVGESVAYDVALEILDSMDPELYRDMVRRYPDVDPDFFIEAAPVSADELLQQYAAQYENSDAVLEVAVGRLADVVYSIVGQEAETPEETMALRKTAENVRSYADCLVERVQAGVITAGDALKELREEAKQWDWTAEQKKYVKNRLQGKIAEKHGVSHEKALEILDELEAMIFPRTQGKRPFDSGRTPAQEVVSGGGVQARDVRVGQQDIATLLKELPRAQAQSLIRTLDDPGVLSEVLEGLGKGDDTSDARQWLMYAPGASEDLLATYAEDPDPSNRILGLRELASRYPEADLSSWFEDPFPYIAQTAKELQPGEGAREGLPEVPAPAPAPLETTTVPLAGEMRQAAPDLPGAAPPEFPEQPESPEEEEEKKRPARKRRKRGAIGVPKELALTYDAPNEQFVMYDPDYGLISPEGAREKEIRGQLQAFRVRDDTISEALKAAKKEIVQIRIAQGAFGDVQELIKDAVQTAVIQLSPEAPRANLMMVAMDELAKTTSAEDAKQLQNQIKEVLNKELEMYPRPEIPGTNQEFTQIAGDAVKTGRTYEAEEKKKNIKDLGKHGIPLQMEFEKEPPEDIPPNRQLSTIAESLFGFAVDDRVRDQAMPELTGVVDGFGIGNTIRVAMDPSVYNPEGGIGIYSPDGLIKIS